jgi:cytochrome c oxidase subunit 2
VERRESMKSKFLICLPLVLLAMLAFTNSPSVRADGSARVVEITAKRFAFVPNSITLKKGETATLRLHSEDVTHGFFMRALKIDEVIEPGQTKDVTITPQTAGSFTTICDHFCGVNHGNMNMTIVVE